MHRSHHAGPSTQIHATVDSAKETSKKITILNHIIAATDGERGSNSTIERNGFIFC
jgi:hypothetical protein